MTPCANCSSIPDEVEASSSDTPELPQLALLARLDPKLSDPMRCARCGALFRFAQWTPGGSDDFQTTTNYCSLHRLTPLQGYDELCRLFEQQRVAAGLVRSIPLAAPEPENQEAWARAVVEEAAAWLTARHAIRYDHPSAEMNEFSRGLDEGRARRYGAAIVRFAFAFAPSALLLQTLDGLTRDPDEGVQKAASQALATVAAVGAALPAGVPIPAPRPGEDAPILGILSCPVEWIDAGAAEPFELALDGSGELLFVAAEHGERWCLRAATGERVWRASVAEQPGYPHVLAASSQWLAVATVNPLGLELWEPDGARHRLVPLPSSVGTVTWFSPLEWIGGGPLLGVRANGSDLRTFLVVDAASLQVLWQVAGEYLWNVVASPDGSRVALWWFSAGGKSHVDVVDSRTGQTLCKISPPSSQGMAWSRDSQRLILSGYTVTNCHRVDSGQPLWQASHPHTSNGCARFSPDGARVACKHGERGFAILDSATGKQLSIRTIAHAEDLVALDWVRGSGVLVTAGHEGLVRAWGGVRSELMAEFAYPAGSAARWLLTALDSPVAVFSPAAGKVPLWRLGAPGLAG